MALLSSPAFSSPRHFLLLHSHRLQSHRFGGDNSSSNNPAIIDSIPSYARHSRSRGFRFPSYQRLSSRDRCSAVGEGGQGPPEAFEPTVYRGTYGPWTVEPADVREVILYRSGLVTAAVSFIIATSVTFLPDSSTIRDVIKQNHDLLYAVGSGGLGLSLFLIHIYVTPIKRFLQLLWAVGVVGSLGTHLTSALPLNESLAHYVFSHPITIWYVGPMFASLTGLVFKEGLCYGKLEAGILTFVIPSLLLGHLSGLMDEGVEHGLLGLWMILFVVFAARKFTQPIKDDIGDKSVFMFNALPEEEKKIVLQRLEQQFDDKAN